ncbi:MAG: sulfatase-like hydrolase/transferase, partial [Planctomycetes bacterium]|nr:sulfatase-like hydrolase/transferase [Planctomycetota bacterium]
MNSSRGSRLAMWRVRGAAALGLGALLLAAACGSNASVEVGPRPVRLYDALDGATLEGPGAAQRSSAFPARELQSAELASWRALAWQGLPVDLTAAAPGASRELDALKLGPETSAWLGIVEAPPGASLAFEAGIQGAGLGGVGDSAKLGIIEFVERPGPEQLTNFAKHMVAAHFGDPVQLDSGGTAQLLVRTDESTRYLVLLLLLGNESQNPELGVTFHDLTLRPATEQDRLRAILGTRDEDLGERAQPAARLAPFQVAMTQRRALLLASDERLELPLGGVSAGDELDLSLGIVPQLVDPLKAPLGAVLSFSIGLVDAAGSEHPLGSLTLEATSATQERWHALRLPLPTASQVPAGWRAPLRLVVRATSPLERNEAPLGLVAEPRLVPAALKSSAPRRAERRPNIIVISIDTLRADRMSLFGNPRPTTPAIDALARRSLVFERAWSNGAYTLPSHMSLFTGQVPSLHGVQDATTKRDPVRSPLLAEQLAARGYTTVAFTGGGFVDPGFGFGAGFDSYGTLDPMVNT